MEEWLHWAESWSVIILQPYKQGRQQTPILHHPQVLKMWTALRAIIMHFLRPMAEHADQAAVSAVTEHLKTYSSLVEEVCGPSMCKYNLHLVTCRCVRAYSTPKVLRGCAESGSSKSLLNTLYVVLGLLLKVWC